LNLIAISGGTGSGKTTFVQNLTSKLDNKKVAIISQDCYYKHCPKKTIEQRKKVNYDHPDSIEWSLLIKHLDALNKGKEVDIPQYSFKTNLRLKNTIRLKPKNIIILEGILILSQQKVVERSKLKIFVDCDADERILRVAQRDVNERGWQMNEIADRYVKMIKPMHDFFIEPSKKHANIVVPKGGENKVAIDIIAHYINSL